MERALWHLFTEVFCLVVAKAFELIDEELYKETYKPMEWRVSRRDTRTVYYLSVWGR